MPSRLEEIAAAIRDPDAKAALSPEDRAHVEEMSATLREQWQRAEASVGEDE